MAEPDLLNVPQIQPFQLDGGGTGAIPRSVNLFRGDVGFSLGLVSLPGRNGLDVSVCALYRSNVAGAAVRRNLDAPTGVLGLGWTVPVDRITVNTNGSGAPADWDFALVRDDTANRIYSSARRWARGVLDQELATRLTQGRIAPEVRRALLGQGIATDPSATVSVRDPGQAWSVGDPVGEFTLVIEDTGPELTVYDGGLAYEAQSFDFSRIRYYPDFQRWEVTHDNGITSVFGGSAGQSVAWGVRWQSWLGPGTLTHDADAPNSPVQQRFPVAWHLSGAHTAWGDRVRFDYEQVSQAVGAGGLTYTKACYLATITDVFGRTVRFGYRDKVFQDGPEEPREYLDPDKAVPDDTPDAFQNRYETRYLDSVTVGAEDGEELYRFVFGYELRTFATPPANAPRSVLGDSAKRVLTSIRKVNPDGSTLPDVTFTYWGATDPNPGAIRSMTYAEGGSVTYEYQSKELTACVRDVVIDNPFPQGTPRVWFGPDYAVVVWFDQPEDPRRYQITMYTWVGRWRRWRAPVVDASPDLTDVHVAMSGEFFVLYHGMRNGQNSWAQVFHRDDRVLGGWLADQDNPIVIGTLDREIVCGRSFFAVNDTNAGTVTRYGWDPLAMRWRTDAVLGGCDPGLTGRRRFYVTAVNTVLVTLCYDVDDPPGDKHNVVQVHEYHEITGWHLADQRTAPEITIGATDDTGLANDFAWSATPWGVTASFVTNDRTSQVEYRVLPYVLDATHRLVAFGPFAYRLPKSQPSGALTIPYRADATANGILASGPNLLRYNGSRWLTNDALALRLDVTDETVFWFAVGPDCVVKTENSPDRVIGAACAYDPNSDTTSWHRAAISLADSRPDEPRTSRYYPTAAPDFVSFDLDLHPRGTSTDWADLRTRPPYVLPSGTITSSTINEPEFLAYLTPGPDGVPRTEVLVLFDGYPGRVEILPELIFRLVRADGTPVADVDGKAPAGPGSLVTFPTHFQDFENAQRLTLRRFVTGSVVRPIEDHPVARVTVDDGYQLFTHSYEFEEDTAECDPSGTTVKYYRSWDTSGPAPRQGGVGWTRHEYINGLGGHAAGDNPTAPALLDGLVERTTTYDADGHVAALSTSAWQIVTSAPNEPGGRLSPLRGAYLLTESKTETLDGVTRTSALGYDPASGQLASRTTTIHNGLGEQETHAWTYRYGHQVYPQLWRANMLGKIVQSTATIAGTVTEVDVTTHQAFQRPAGGDALTVWDWSRTYRWLGGDGPSDFDFGAPTPSAAWCPLTEVHGRSARGQLLAQTAPGGVLTSWRYDRDEGLTVASFTNASPYRGDACYFGFESYEDTGGIAITAPATIDDTTAHAGLRCLRLPTSDGAVAFTVTPVTGQRYLFACWAKTGPGYQAGAPAGWRLTPQGGPPIDVVLPPSPEWRYHAEVVETAASTVTCTAYNTGTADVYFDDIAFSCYRGQHRVSVYDHPYLTVGAELGPYDNVLRRRHDPLLRVVAQTDDTEGVVRIVAPYLSRQHRVSFDAAEPNAQTLVQPMGTTLLDEFRDDGWHTHWTSTTPDQWATVTGRLSHLGRKPGSITLTEPALTGDYCVHVNVEPTELLGPLGLSAGAALSVLWDGKWTLTAGSDVLTAPGGPGRAWLLVVTTDALLFLVDGERVFSRPLGGVATGAPGLRAAGPVNFTNVVVGSACQVGVKFFDATGKSRQGHSIEGTASVVTASLYDGIGRAAVTTKPASYPATAGQPLLAYRSTFVTGFDWTTGVLTGDLAKSYPLDEGYPYQRQAFEPSPLGRTVEIGAPGKPYAIGGPTSVRHTVRVAYGTNAAGVGPAGHLPAGKYFVRTTTDQDGRISEQVTDALRTPVLTAALADPATSRYIVTSAATSYLRTGRRETQYLPNYHNPPDPAHRDAWVRVATYDMLGRQTSATEPNSGEVTRVFDTRGQLRFSQNRAAASAGLVVYRTYDDLGRVLVEGTFPFAWDRAVLMLMADADPAWPGPHENALPLRTYHYDGPEITRAGQLAGITVAGGAIEYHYDDRNRMFRQRATVGVTSQESTYQYDNLGNVSGIDYPSGLRVRYTRDGAGRVHTIRDGDGKPLASFKYDAADRVITEAIATRQVEYTYNSPGWLRRIGAGDFVEDVDYTDSYSGKVAGQEVRFTVPAGGDFPSAVTHALRYDPTGRLATATTDDHINPQWTQLFAYDDNGNLTSVRTGDAVEKYTYQPGTDFAVNTDGSTNSDYVPDGNGAVAMATPRGIGGIDYDLLSGLPTAIRATGGDFALRYDASNRRLVKTTSGGERIYLRNQTGWCLAELDVPATGAPLATEYLYGPTGLFAVRRSGLVHPVLRDHLRAPRLLGDPAGGVHTALQYEPFGELLGAYRDPAMLRYRFGGYELDPETGLYNASARLYDPKLRRFYAVDPAQQYASAYAFAGNDPLTTFDPNGTSPWWAMLIGAIVGTVVTIATGGAGALLLGTEIAAAMAVGAVAGAAGSLTGDATTAALAREPITGTRLLVDALAGAAGGAAGAGVGGAVSGGAMRVAAGVAEDSVSLVSGVGTAAALVVGGASGAAASAVVGSALTGQPLFTAENGLNVAIGALSGFGAALMASGAHFGWFGAMPIELGVNDFDKIKADLNFDTVGGTNHRLLTFVSDEAFTNTERAVIAEGGSRAAIFQVAAHPNSDVIAVHGVGRYVFPMTTDGYSRPMSAPNFARYIQSRFPNFDAAQPHAAALPPIKLLICFGALPGPTSVGQTLASALGRTTYAGRGVVYPADLSRSWVTFTP